MDVEFYPTDKRVFAMIEIISRLDLHDIFWKNGLIRNGSGSKIVGRSNWYAVFDWETVKNSIQAGIISIHDQYEYRPQGDPGGEFNCSEWAAIWWTEMIKTYAAMSGYPLGAVPWAGALTDGYFTDLADPSRHHGPGFHGGEFS